MTARQRKIVVGSAAALVATAAAMLLLTRTSTTRAQAGSNPQPVLVSQPELPLEVLSMKPTVAPPNASAEALQRMQKMAFYEVVLKNKAPVPVRAYAISHEAGIGDKMTHTCQSGLGITNALIAAGESKTISANLQKHGNATTRPVIDLVLLEDGTYYGKDACGVLADFSKRLDERIATYGIVLERMERDGASKTAEWLKQERNKDLQPLFSPRKAGPAI